MTSIYGSLIQSQEDSMLGCDIKRRIFIQSPGVKLVPASSTHADTWCLVFSLCIVSSFITQRPLMHPVFFIEKIVPDCTN